jgi:hypothetical protein
MDASKVQVGVDEDSGLGLSADGSTAPTIPADSPLLRVGGAEKVVMAALQQQSGLLREVLALCDDPPLPTEKSLDEWCEIILSSGQPLPDDGGKVLLACFAAGRAGFVMWAKLYKEYLTLGYSTKEDKRIRKKRRSKIVGLSVLEAALLARLYLASVHPESLSG